MNDAMRYFLVLFMCSVLLLPVSSHSGGTDSKGGHHSGSSYHYHHGHPAHQHEDIDGDGDEECLYEVEQTASAVAGVGISAAGFAAYKVYRKKKLKKDGH